MLGYFFLRKFSVIKNLVINDYITMIQPVPLLWTSAAQIFELVFFLYCSLAQLELAPELA